MKFLRKFFITSLFSFTLVCNTVSYADAGLFNGIIAYEMSNYSIAFKEFKASAQKGSADAQNYLGVMYKKGQGVNQNYFKAVEWYRKAAEQGHVSAQINLGVMYENGDGVRQNHFKAVEWYRKAAEKGSADAQFNLGLNYLLGRGVTHSRSKAKEWFGKACDNQMQEGCEVYAEMNEN